MSLFYWADCFKRRPKMQQFSSYPSLCFADVFNKPLSACCPTEYLHSCCPEVTKPCNTSATMRPLKPQPRGPVVKPFCMKPQNSTACEAGFYFDNLAKQVEPCPDGKTTLRHLFRFCELVFFEILEARWRSVDSAQEWRSRDSS